MAGRVGIYLSLDDWDRCGRYVPTIVNLMPSGKYLMEALVEPPIAALVRMAFSKA
ncbi:hypothetical protein ACC724_38475 [Rhizobium ruizarguesonis]